MPQATRTVFYWRSKICNFSPSDKSNKLLLPKKEDLISKNVETGLPKDLQYFLLGRVNGFRDYVLG